MKIFISIFFASGLVLFSLFSFLKAETNNGNDGRCTGSAYCSTCSNCSKCGHCGSGGTCSGSSSGRGFSSARYSSYKKKKRSYTKAYSSNRGSSKSKSTLEIYSSSRKKTPIFYYNSNTSINNENLLHTTYKTVNIRSGAGKNYPIVETVKLNTKLIFLNEKGSWYEVRVSNSGKEGYVYTGSVK